jgi:hypothetical protein
LTYDEKLKDLNLKTAAPGRGKGGSKCLRLWASTGSTVVEELTHDTKIEGLNPETKAIGREKTKKQSTCSCGLRVVAQ